MPVENPSPPGVGLDFAALMAPFASEGVVALAVSGGGDSMALLELAADWAPGAGVSLHVFTVDHGLRPEAAGEAEFVAAHCAIRGLPHDVLRPSTPISAEPGNLTAAARAARYALLRAACAGIGARSLLVGHTRDDQAETLLMRIARGSGVDGLAGMAAASDLGGGLRLLRPLLGAPRAALREILVARGVGWREDPTNDDLRFDRAKARAALQALGALGISDARLAQTASAMGRARAALSAAALAAIEGAAVWSSLGEARLYRAGLRAQTEEVGLRALAQVLMAVSGAPYPPRFSGLERVYAFAVGDEDDARTLHGCVLRAAGPELWVIREPRAAEAAFAAQTGGLWDGRFTVETSAGAVRPHGAQGVGSLRIAQVEGWRPRADWAIAHPAARRSAPALWLGDEIIASPLAGWVAPQAPHWAHQARFAFAGWARRRSALRLWGGADAIAH